MYSKAKDYRPIIGFEGLYLLNCLGTIKALDREFEFRGEIRLLKENPPIIKKTGSTIYAMLRDKNRKTRKVNITEMIKNVFGRQRPIREMRKNKPLQDFVKPSHKTGTKGIPVEQYEDGKLLKVFPTFAAAARAVGGTPVNVSDAAHGKIKSYAGYKWKLKKQ